MAAASVTSAHWQRGKEIKHKIIANRLSLKENYAKSLDERSRREYKVKITQLTHNQPIIQPNGLFEIYNIKESDLQFVRTILGRQDFIEYIQASGEKLDFGKLNIHGIPAKKYKITGKIKF